MNKHIKRFIKQSQDNAGQVDGEKLAILVLNDVLNEIENNMGVISYPESVAHNHVICHIIDHYEV